jgi:hypothetical protein
VAYAPSVQIPDPPLTLTKAEAATRQVEAAIEALERGNFDIAITLAGAAECILACPESLFAYQRDHPKAQELGIEKEELLNHLNKERNWLKHLSGPDTMEITRYSAAFMIARAVTKLKAEYCTAPIKAFWRWWTEEMK